MYVYICREIMVCIAHIYLYMHVRESMYIYIYIYMYIYTHYMDDPCAWTPHRLLTNQGPWGFWG